MGPLLLRHITLELDERLSGGVVSRVHQPDEKNLLIKVFVGGHEERLLISAHPLFSRMHLTGRAFENPPAPLRFCAFLRSRITNARIDGISQAEGERIVRIGLKKKNGDSIETMTLVAELTGKSGNLILLDSAGVILDALRYFDPETSVRAVVPGLPLTPLPPAPVAAEVEIPKKAGESWNEAADRYYSALLDDEVFTLEKSRLRRAINEAAKKAARKLNNLLGDKKRAEAEKGYGGLGELIVYNLKDIKRGATEAEAVDYSLEPPAAVKVKLDPKLSPKENAEKYFKRAKKAKVALTLLGERIPKVADEIDYIDTLVYELDDLKTKEDLALLKDELVEGGYLKEMTGRVKTGPVEKVEPVRRFTSTEGFEILCGRSGPGNDLIVKKYAASEDIWFHVSKMPGSHVLIKVAGRGAELTKKTIEEAASLAAWHSKAQNASKVEVIYAEARHVRKPRGAKPGMVTVKEHKSILVRPKELAGGSL
ncbi:MAG: NFACT family protein [Deltaproteobacteria bacterium]|nr:NFACT family protein [Deltaproteobacteria bacterium]